MKKAILFLFFCCSMCIYAQDVTFPINSQGKIEFTGECKSSLSKQELFDRAKIWIAKTFNSTQVIISENASDGIIMVRGAVKGRSSYNPFKGLNTETVGFIMKLTCGEGSINYMISDVELNETYVGYGTNNKVIKVLDRVKELNSAKQEIRNVENDPNKSKKDKKKVAKENSEKIEDISDSLTHILEGIDEFVKGFKSEFE